MLWFIVNNTAHKPSTQDLLFKNGGNTDSPASDIVLNSIAYKIIYAQSSKEAFCKCFFKLSSKVTQTYVFSLLKAHAGKASILHQLMERIAHIFRITKDILTNQIRDLGCKPSLKLGQNKS